MGKATIAENNQEYQITTVEEDFLLQYFEPVSLSEAEFFLTATQILDRLSMFAEIHVNNGSNISIGKYLKKHNFQRKKIAGIYKWAVKPKKGMDDSKYK